MKKGQIQWAGFYLAGLLCLVLAVVKLALDMPWSWWRVLLPTWLLLWQSAVYVGGGFIWMTGKGRGRATGDVKIRRRHGLDRYQLWSMLFASLFVDNVLRRVGGRGESAWWWLASGRLDALLLTGGSMLACQFLFWSGSVETGKPNAGSESRTCQR